MLLNIKIKNSNKTSSEQNFIVVAKLFWPFSYNVLQHSAVEIHLTRTLLKSTLLATDIKSSVQPLLRRLGTGHKTGQKIHTT